MPISWKQSLERYRQFIQFSDPEHLEAPDRSFIGHRDILVRNLARYTFIQQLISGRTLDLGCGRGYGFELLQAKSSECIGIDISKPFLHEAQALFPNLPLILASGSALPFADESFDSIVSFEVIEHVPDDIGFLRDIQRIARPGAQIIISTPNRLVASGESEQPINKFHVREYTTAEYHALLSQVFSGVTLYGQREGSSGGLGNSVINRIPVHWKYQLPIHIQGILSVYLRQPLRLEDCHFDQGHLEEAHTLLAVCQR